MNYYYRRGTVIMICGLGLGMASGWRKFFRLGTSI